MFFCLCGHLTIWIVIVGPDVLVTKVLLLFSLYISSHLTIVLNFGNKNLKNTNLWIQRFFSSKTTILMI